jgi:hypothetical protein
MGYFDALTSSYFKVAPDGRRLFFPWGVLGRGYALVSEQQYERLRRQLKIYTAVSLIAIVASAGLRFYIATLVIGAALMIYYALWSRYLLSDLQATQERLSPRDSLSAQARVHSTFGLWSLEIVALVFVVGGVFLLVADRHQWVVAAGCVVFFGACAAVFGYMLVLRGRTGDPRDGTTQR